MLENDRARDDEWAQRRMMLAALEASGADGYGNLTVQRIVDRSGRGRMRFYQLFRDTAHCYTAAYEVEMERLSKELMGAAAAEQSWRAGLSSALERLARFLVERPLLARGLADVHMAGGPALEKRVEVFERLSRAMDCARGESEHGPVPPPVVATFTLGAIEHAATSALARGRPEEFADAVPTLTYIATAAYFGTDKAWKDLSQPPGRATTPDPAA